MTNLLRCPSTSGSGNDSANDRLTCTKLSSRSASSPVHKHAVLGGISSIAYYAIIAMNSRRVKFVEVDTSRGGLPVKRKQVQHACASCRRKKVISPVFVCL